MELTGRTILVVDDNADDRFFVSKALERIAPGSLPHYASSGDEAVAYLEGCGHFSDRVRFPYPSFLITDLEMAEGDGFSILQNLQQTLPAHRLPVLMLSSSGDPLHVQRAYALGATWYCEKPVGRAPLCELLNAFFNGYVHTQTPGEALARGVDGTLAGL